MVGAVSHCARKFALFSRLAALNFEFRGGAGWGGGYQAEKITLKSSNSWKKRFSEKDVGGNSNFSFYFMHASMYHVLAGSPSREGGRVLSGFRSRQVLVGKRG